MSLEIKAVWKRNTNQTLPVSNNCNCCGASLSRVIIVTLDDKSWGRDCYARAIGKPKVRIPALSMLDKALKELESAPLVGDIIVLQDKRQLTVTAPAFLEMVRGRYVAMTEFDGKRWSLYAFGQKVIRNNIWVGTYRQGMSAKPYLLGYRSEEGAEHERAVRAHLESQFKALIADSPVPEWVLSSELFWKLVEKTSMEKVMQGLSLV